MSQSLQTTPVTTLPLGRTPVLDGASGLHYSGRVYTNQVQVLGKDICSTGSVPYANATDVMPSSISSSNLPVDPTSQRISMSALQGYVNNLQATGAIPGQMGTFDDQMAADKQFYAALQREYCFYEARYVAALGEFLTLISAPVAPGSGSSSNPTLDTALQTTIDLNGRLNSLLEIMNYVGNERARSVNLRSPQIDAANATLDNKIAILTRQKQFLESGDVRTQTQEEMMRFSAEKNRAMNIQILFFVALNVVALGTVFTVYKGIGPGSQ
jgi:hypothetical protein